ncbi:MAG TPA: type VII secretion-associated serine protease mycosin [Mycobacterium sp.]|nr:type VII secretion-associated serine protease mycosin [Mycobacterium sp.]
MRLVRIAAVTALTAVSQCAAAPPALAVSPPSIDSTLLPAAAPPAPAQPTVQRTVCAVPTFDPDRTAAASQLDSLGLPDVWPLTRGAGQRVAVIDTGVSPHRRLPRLVGGGDYASTGDGTQDCDGHGTLVAGIIAAAADPGADRFSGVAPEATVIAIRQSSTKFGPAGDPSRVGVGDVETLAKAVRTAADLGASIINVSAVACEPVGSGLDDRALGAALAYAVEVKNAVVVAAAGNTGTDQPCPAQDARAGWNDATVAVSPAWYDDYVLTVGSVNADGAPSAFTLAGPWVDVAAPGEAVFSLSPVGDAMANKSIFGTSYAAPVVSGLAALIRSRFPAWTPRQVMERIKATAHHPAHGRDNVVGSGVIDPVAAVSAGAPVAVGTPGSDDAEVPITAPQTPAPESGGRRTALTGAALLAALVVVLAGRAISARSRPRH